MSISVVVRGEINEDDSSKRYCTLVQFFPRLLFKKTRNLILINPPAIKRGFNTGRNYDAPDIIKPNFANNFVVQRE